MTHITHKLLGTKKAEKMFSDASKKCRKSAHLAFEDTTLFAHETAVKRSKRVVLRKKPGTVSTYIQPTSPDESKRPFQRTGSYRRSIHFKITRTGKFVGQIIADVNYAKHLEEKYQNLEISADIAVKKFPDFLKKTFRAQMRKRNVS